MKRLISAWWVLALIVAAAPAAAQDFIDWGEATSRGAGAVVPIYDPTIPGYRYITLENLLSGTGVAFDDELTRYVAVSDADTPPTFTGQNFLDGSSGTGFLDCIGFPMPPAGAGAIYVGIAVPETWTLTWIDLTVGPSPQGLNSINVFQQLVDTVDIGGADYTVWRSFARQSTAFLNENSYACLHPLATVPTQ